MIKFGPLHENRHNIVKQLCDIELQTGDILYRASDAKGPLGFPFSRFIAYMTNSLYSHAAIVLIENNQIYVMEINDAGTVKLRMIDWLDGCFTPEFSVYRLIETRSLMQSNTINKLRVEIWNQIEKDHKNLSPSMNGKVQHEIDDILEEDADYDFTFSDAKKYYCTEAVAVIYERAGIKLCEPAYIKDCISWWNYAIFAMGNWASGKLFGIKMPLDRTYYFVGNENIGLMSSKLTKLVLHYQE